MIYLEARANEIDKAWIEGIRKTWKAWVKKASSFPGYALKAPAVDHALIKQASVAAVAYLEQGRTFIRRLREDLLINKGFWTRLDPDEANIKTSKKTVVGLLRDAEDAIEDGITRAQGWVQLTEPNHGRDGIEAYKSQEDFDRFFRTISLTATEAATNADAIVSRKLLRFLTTLVTRDGGVIDHPGYDPSELKVGGVTLVFLDTPKDPTRKYDQQYTRNPTFRTKYIQTFKNTQALLDRRDLGFLWYGRIEIHAAARAPENQYGAHFGTGAEYYRQGDYVKVYNDPHPALERLIAHELAHRYWYKFLTLAERERFGEWFGKVQATSSYGAKASAEDFAEVFADYVMGANLSRDQIDRLKAFLAKSKRLESLQFLQDLLAERIETFSEANVEKLRKDFLTLMKNVAKVDTYEQARTLGQAIRVWNERFNTLIFDQMVPGIRAAVTARMGEHYPDLEAWVKSWDEKVRADCWKLHTEMRLPFEAISDYTRKYDPDLTPERAVATFLRERDKWAARVKRAAQKAWKTLNDYLDWLGKGTAAHAYEVPSDDTVELEGFRVRIYGADMKDWASRGQKVVEIFKAGLKEYRRRAKEVFPWLVRYQLPLELRFDCGLDWGGRYEGTHIVVCAYAVDDAKKTSHVLAHEMGHHVWKVYLSGEAQRFWEAAIKADRGELDLVKLAAIWEREAPTGHLTDLENHLKSDPILFLQVETLTHGYGNYGKSIFFSLEELKDLIAKGTRTYPVPKNPITAYAAKNPEEAFCEAFGYLVAYGPRSVLPLVRRWLRQILPEIRTEEVQDRAVLAEWVQELRALLR